MNNSIPKPCPGLTNNVPVILSVARAVPPNPAAPANLVGVKACNGIIDMKIFLKYLHNNNIKIF